MRVAVCSAALSVALAGCGPAAPPVIPAETLAATDPRGAGEEPTLGIPQPLVEIGLVVKDLEGFYLFDDEQLEAAMIVAAWATSAGLIVEKPARTREIFRRAANGQHIDTGAACGSPLWSLAAIERWREELHAEGRIEPSVQCLPNCVLTVKVSEGLDAAARDAGRTAMWTAAFDPSKPWRSELARALAALAPQEVSPDSSVRAGGARPRPQIVDAAFAPDDEAVLPDATVASARACLGDTGAIGVVLDTDAAGTVTRCEGYAQRIVANGPVAACACKALVGRSTLTAGGPPSAGPRRLATTILLPQGASTVAIKGGKLVDARIAPTLKRDAGTKLYLQVVSNRSVREWEPPMPWTIAACFATLAPTSIAIRANLLIHVDGKTAKVTATDITPTSSALSPAQATCVREAIARATKVPCSEPGAHTLSAELVVELRDP